MNTDVPAILLTTDNGDRYAVRDLQSAAETLLSEVIATRARLVTIMKAEGYNPHTTPLLQGIHADLTDALNAILIGGV